MCANHILASVLAYEMKRPKDLLIKSIVFLKYNRNMSNHKAYEIHNRNLMCLFATKCGGFPLNELFALSEHLPTVDVNPSSCSRTSQATFILLASCMATYPGILGLSWFHSRRRPGWWLINADKTNQDELKKQARWRTSIRKTLSREKMPLKPAMAISRDKSDSGITGDEVRFSILGRVSRWLISWYSSSGNINATSG